MASHSSTVAQKISWTEEPGRLQSTGSLLVRHNSATSLSLFTFMHWRRKWQPTPVFLPGESQGRGCLVGCCLWGHTESDMTEATQQQQQQKRKKACFFLIKSYCFYFQSISRICPFFPNPRATKLVQVTLSPRPLSTAFYQLALYF